MAAHREMIPEQLQWQFDVRLSELLSALLQIQKGWHRIGFLSDNVPFEWELAALVLLSQTYEWLQEQNRS